MKPHTDKSQYYSNTKSYSYIKTLYLQSSYKTPTELMSNNIAFNSSAYLIITRAIESI